MQIAADFKLYENILKDELRPAMGCTEPIAIAYAASILSDALGCIPGDIDACFSGNIIKNVKSVIVPMTGGGYGIDTAICAGLLSSRPDLFLEVLTVLPENAGEEIERVRAKTNIKISELNSGCTFELKLCGRSSRGEASVVIVGEHTNVTEVIRNGANITEKYLYQSASKRDGTSGDRTKVTVEGILKYAGECSLDTVAPLLRRQIELNMAIANEGLTGDWGASIGKILLATGDGTAIRARAYAAAGSDARMSGCELPVCIISGSGNQGITASVPVIIYARDLGVSEEALLRALIVSDLVTVHQKTGIGTLSAYCGAISAGVGAAAGICYLMGGDYSAVSHTIVNAVAILSGTICDGAKPSCAAKIAMAVEAGILGYQMSKMDKQFYGGDGIITKGVENTIRNVGRLAKDGMSETDREIIKIMLETSRK